MNKAQKRAWICFAVSLATIVIASAVIAFIRINQIDIYERTRFRILGVLNTIPLISIVIISARFPTKKFDERDKLIDRKALIIGSIGVFIFLGAASGFLCVVNPAGSIRNLLIPFLVYLAFFVWLLVSSAAGLILYGWGSKGEKS